MKKFLIRIFTMLSLTFSVIISLLFLTNGCSLLPTVEKDLEKYYERYQETAELYDHHNTSVFLRIKYSDKLEPNIMGVCYPGKRLIMININAWKYLDDPEKEQIMFHELGHCLQFKDHTNTRSMMYPYTLGSFYYLYNYQEIMDDFFDCKKDCPKVKYRRY